MDKVIDKYLKINHLNVSREACLDFEKFIDYVLKKNEILNIIAKSTQKREIIRERHIIDSAQAIEFIDLNCDSVYDLGSGGGFPGIIIGIMLKNRGNKVKMKLFEKSYHKSVFLREVVRKLNLDIEIIQKDIFEIAELNTGTIIARAFKPMPVMLKLVNEKFVEYKNLILFMGKKGREALEESKKNWIFEYEEKKSLTSEDSFLINIKNIKKI
ncbi:16S rRNA (guanine(527)-N(7))-methyltransferase RsmG [Candidatus Pelagibacter bacterium]|nr:16S rRNA (guanine(527)-N(7))-methyltransferase RsmG [Candidatus Pelagibacter bacterium]